MKIAGLELPQKLEFGNTHHIALKKEIERRLDYLDQPGECPYCGSDIRAIPHFEDGFILTFCDLCGYEFEEAIHGTI